MSETSGNLRKRTLGETEDVEDPIKPKTHCNDDTESSSSGTSSSSSSSTSLSSDSEQTTSDTTSSADLPIPFGPLTDCVHLHSQVDAWKR